MSSIINIAVNLPFVTHGYTRRVILGILDCAADHPNVRLHLASNNMIAGPEESPNIQGVIGDAPGKEDGSHPLPVINVYTSRKSSGPRTGPDHRAIARMAFRHLLSCGCRHMAVLDVDKFREIRSQPFVDVCQDLGIKPQVIHVDDWVDEGAETDQIHRFRDQLARLPKPAGLFLPLDGFYPFVADVCQDLGLRIPEDLGVLGVNNDTSVCLNATPTLSSIDPDTERIGYAALENLLEMIREDSTPGEILIPPREVIIRESTRAAVGENVDVTKALDMIHRDFSEPLTTDDLLACQKLGRRAFETRFRMVCGTSPKQYLIQLRLSHARNLLETTGLPVVEIGNMCGIPNITYLCRAFRTKYGLSPGAFRMKKAKQSNTFLIDA